MLEVKFGSYWDTFISLAWRQMIEGELIRAIFGVCWD